MTPFLEAKEYFGEYFDSMLEYYMADGYVYSGPDAFAMAIPHSSAILMERNLNKKVDKCDCWFVHYVSGSLERLMDLLEGLPLKFEYVVFERDIGEIDRFSDEHQYKKYNLRKLQEKVHGKRKST